MQRKYSIEPERITSRPRRLSLLRRLKDQFLVLTVLLPESWSRYSSAILGVHPEDEYLTLDELMPADGHEHFLQVRECTIEVFTKGQGLRFTTRLISKGRENGIAYYRIALPSSIDYYLQRSNHRVPLPPGGDALLLLRGPNEMVLEARVLDLSLGGVSFKLPPSPWAERLGRGTELPSCRLVLDEGETLSFDLRVTYTARAKDGRSVCVGAQILKLTKRHRGRLQRYIMALDRERLKAASSL